MKGWRQEDKVNKTGQGDIEEGRGRKGQVRRKQGYERVKQGWHDWRQGENRRKHV
jgi:hypothetical protein